MTDPLLDILKGVPMRCADCGATTATDDRACPGSTAHTWETDDAAIARAVRRWLREQLAALLDASQ